jgi:hypothetical protein
MKYPPDSLADLLEYDRRRSMAMSDAYVYFTHNVMAQNHCYASHSKYGDFS